MNIDWSKAPEGATHYIVEECARNKWLKEGPSGDLWHYGDEGWIKYPVYSPFKEAHIHASVKRPSQQEWNGEGLPPVGLKVEGQIEGCSEWIPLTLRYVSTDFSVFEKADGNEFPLWNPQYAKFRPIRTPEQIAAEEREAELNRMVATAKMLDKGWARKVCAELYDAGYRKQEQPK